MKEALRKAGYAVPEPKETNLKTLKCKKCGGEIRFIRGTNIAACTGTREDGRPCNYYIVLKNMVR